MARKWWTLITVSIATFMLLLDVTIVNVALPEIKRELGGEPDGPSVGGGLVRPGPRRPDAEWPARWPTGSAASSSSPPGSSGPRQRRCSPGSLATPSRSPSAGRTYLVDDHRLFLNCVGSGSPTVVLFNGLGERTPIWAWVQSAVAQQTRVCTFDRAGQGWSGKAPERQDGHQLAADLHGALTSLPVTPSAAPTPSSTRWTFRRRLPASR